MKWTVTGNYATSDCGRYIVNWTESGQYMAVRLGTPDRGAWKGSEILAIGGKDECKAACECYGRVDADEH